MTNIINDITASGRAKCLDGKHLALFHLGLVTRLHKRDGLATVNEVLLDVVTRKVADGLDAVRLAADLDLVALHNLLNGCAHIADADVDPRGLKN